MLNLLKFLKSKQNRFYFYILFILSYFDFLSTVFVLKKWWQELNNIYSFLLDKNIIYFTSVRLFIVPLVVYYFFNKLFQNNLNTVFLLYFIILILVIINNFYNFYKLCGY